MWPQVMGHRVSDLGQVGSWASLSDWVFDPVVNFTMHMFYVDIVFVANWQIYISQLTI